MYVSFSQHNLPNPNIQVSRYRSEASEKQFMLTIDTSDLPTHQTFGRVTIWLTLPQAETLMNELLNATREALEDTHVTA